MVAVYQWKHFISKLTYRFTYHSTSTPLCTFTMLTSVVGVVHQVNRVSLIEEKRKSNVGFMTYSIKFQ